MTDEHFTFIHDQIALLKKIVPCASTTMTMGTFIEAIAYRCLKNNVFGEVADRGNTSLFKYSGITDGQKRGKLP